MRSSAGRVNSKTGLGFGGLLKGSWVVISVVISRVARILADNKGLITPLLTTHEPPSRVWGFMVQGFKGSGIPCSGFRVWGCRGFRDQGWVSVIP